MGNLVKIGRTFFAVSMATFGILYLLRALFAAGPGSGPPWIPTHPFWGYFTAIVLIAAAGCVVARVQVRCAAIALSITILARMLWVYVPKLVATPRDPGPWTSGFELIAMCSAALVLAGAPSTIKLGRFLFAIPLLVFGLQHFLYARFIATLVPSWTPVLGIFCRGCFHRCRAFDLQSDKSPRVRHLAGNYVPSVGNEWTSAFVALAMSAGAFLVAGNSKRKTRA